MPPRRLDAQAAKALLSSVEYILMDVDGVVWSGTNVLPRIPETLHYLRTTQHKQLRFLSNNASLSRRELQQQFSARGMGDVTVHEVYNSAYAAALRLQRSLGIVDPSTGLRLVHGNVFVIGEAGLHEELQAVLAPGFITYGMELHDVREAGGYTSHRLAEAWTRPILPAPLQRLVICDGDRCRMVQAKAKATKGSANGNERDGHHEEEEEGISLKELNAVAVVVGLDLHFNILKLACASMILQGPPAQVHTPHTHFTSEATITTTTITDAAKKDMPAEHTSHSHNSTTESEMPRPALYIATNEDPQIPVGTSNVLVPGAGSMVAALSVASGRKPDAVCGKPNVDMAELLFAAEQIRSPGESCLMVGDRLTTDVAFGNNAGCQSLFVLSGAETMADVAAAQAAQATTLLPNYIADSLAVFLP